MNFKPKIDYYELEYYLEGGFGEIRIKNNSFLRSLKDLLDIFIPEVDEFNDSHWELLYLPVRMYGRLRLIPYNVTKINPKHGEIYVITFRGFSKWLVAEPGKENFNKFFLKILKETKRFVNILRRNPEIIEKLVPYRFRYGWIKTKYILKDLLSKEEAKNILKRYEENLKTAKRKRKINLREYLEVAAICYRAAFGDRTKNLSPLEMYKRWADGRHGGMLDLDMDDREAFMRWYRKGFWAGSHPFEIVFSWERHGILLYPPREDGLFKLYVDNFAYARSYLRMVRALIENRIPFEAPDLKDVLNYLTGEMEIPVNHYGPDFARTFFYHHTPYERKFFRYIRWEKLKIPKFKD